MTTDEPTQGHIGIALRAQQLKVIFLGMSMSVVAMLDPSLPLLSSIQRWTQNPAGQDVPVELKYEQDDADAYVFSAREAMHLLSTFDGAVVREDLLSIGMVMGAIRLGDMIQAAAVPGAGSVPLLQFARHFRNACAHGDRWHFAEGQPSTPASCRHLTLDPSMHGGRATLVSVSPRLYVEFLDDISNYFVPGIVVVPDERV